MELVVGIRRAAGFPEPHPEARIFGERDLEMCDAVADLRDEGVSDEGLLEAIRVFGRGLQQYAQASLLVLGRTDDAAEAEPAGLETALAKMVRQLEPALEHFFFLHVREELRRDFASRVDLADAHPDVRVIYVAFVDMVAFTTLGERANADELGSVVSRFADLSIRAARPPIRLVKMIGDAAMYVSPDARPLVGPMLELLATAEELDDFPALRAGLAAGRALQSEGDWYGSPVNLASRLTNEASPRSIAASDEVRDATADFPWRTGPPCRLKGFDGWTGPPIVPLIAPRPSARSPKTSVNYKCYDPRARMRVGTSSGTRRVGMQVDRGRAARAWL